MDALTLTEDDYTTFWHDGFVIRKSLFDAEEIGLLNQAIGLDEGIRKNIVQVARGRRPSSPFGTIPATTCSGLSLVASGWSVAWKSCLAARFITTTQS